MTRHNGDQDRAAEAVERARVALRELVHSRDGAELGRTIHIHRLADNQAEQARQLHTHRVVDNGSHRVSADGAQLDTQGWGL